MRSFFLILSNMFGGFPFGSFVYGGLVLIPPPTPPSTQTWTQETLQSASYSQETLQSSSWTQETLVST